ncbi:MAG: hypothetical protein Q9213_002687 [Squamulea squamosa]
MKSLAFSLVLLLSQCFIPVLGTPLQALRVRDKEDTPDVETIKKDIAGKVVDGKSLFYTASTGPAARRYRNQYGLKKLQEDIDTDQKYNDISKWKDWDSVVRNWSQAFAELSTGTVWVMFIDLSPIDSNLDSIWNTVEYPALTSAQPIHVFEIIQVSAADFSQQVQIWPVKVATYPADKCKWYGVAPICAGVCAAGTKEVARSNYGDSKEGCTTGHKIYCCDESVFNN